MRVLMVGAGGVGGYLGIRLIQKGCRVAFLLRPDTAKIVGRKGLSLTSPLGDWSGAVEVAGPRDGPFDLVVLSCKAFDLDAALFDIRPFTGPHTYVLPLLNGVRHLDLIGSTFPAGRVLGGVAHIGAATDAPGCIVHLNRQATFLAGPLQHGAALPNRLAGLFGRVEGPGLTMKLVEDASSHMWTKFVFLATLAASTCLRDADIGTILAQPDGNSLILGLLDEAQRIAASEGVHLPADDLERYRRQLTDPASTATASMLRDMRAGRPTEAEHVLGDLANRAARHKIETPNLLSALLHIRAYEMERTKS